MALRGQDAYQLAGLLSQLPTLSGRPNSAGGMGSAFMEMGQQARQEAQRKQTAEKLQGLLGQRAQINPYQQSEAEMFPGEQPIQGLRDIQPGSGLLGGEIGQEEFYGGLLSTPGYEKMGMEGLLAAQGAGSNMPSNVREWQYFQTLPPEDQTRYLQMKRNPTYLDLGPQYVQPGAGGAPANVYEKDLDPNQRPEVQAQQEAAKTEARLQADATTQARIDLPQVIAGAEQMLSVIEGLETHPGRSAATGTSAYLDPRNYMPGSEAWDFKVRSDQLQGKVFLQAYQDLKGGGQITEVEGKKAEAAVARLNRAQSEPEYLSALKELKSVVRVGLERAREKAGTQMDGQQEAAPQIEASKTINGVRYNKINGQWYQE